MPMNLRSSKVKDISFALKKLASNWPYDTNDFRREDESTDCDFYDEPRLVYYVDKGAIDSLTRYYEMTFKHQRTHLDICSSWVSHYPAAISMRKSIGLGMNEYELSQNKQLTEYIVQDLNIDTVIPIESNSVDYVTCVVSIAYLVRPLEVFREIHRILKPGGMFIVSQSIRCWPSKAIKIWMDTDDLGHLSIIRDYFHFAGGFNNVRAFDISQLSDDPLTECDPMYVVQGVKE